MPVPNWPLAMVKIECPFIYASISCVSKEMSSLSDFVILFPPQPSGNCSQSCWNRSDVRSVYGLSWILGAYWPMRPPPPRSRSPPPCIIPSSPYIVEDEVGAGTLFMIPPPSKSLVWAGPPSKSLTFYDGSVDTVVGVLLPPSRSKPVSKRSTGWF